MKRIRDIVTDLRAFAYPESQNLRERFEFPDALETALRFTANDRNGIDVDRELTANVSVMGSKSHITQVLVNLLSNAQRAVDLWDTAQATGSDIERIEPLVIA